MKKKYFIFTFRIYPNKYQKKIIDHTFEICKDIYNLMLKERAYVYNKFIIYTERCLINKIDIDEERFFKYNRPKKIGIIKKLNDNYAKIDNSTIYSEQLSVISAYEKYFAGISGFPKYKDEKSKLIYKTSNTNNNIKVRGNMINIPKLGNVKSNINIKLPINTKIKRAVIKSDKFGKYYVSLILKFKTFSYT